MKILTVEEMNSLGISASELQQSLTLIYLTKKYFRKLDVPKKFKEKVLDICTQISQAGKNHFVTETNYSYAIWEEEKTVNSIINNKTSSLTEVESQTKTQESVSFSLKSYLAEKKDEIKVNNSHAKMKVYIRNSQNYDNNDISQTESQINTTTKETRKYRGAIVNNSVIEPDISPIESQTKTPTKKVRKYRGAIIDENKND